MEKITYASLGSLGDEFHRSFDVAADALKTGLGATHPMFIGGRTRKSAATFTDTSPSDTRIVLGRFQKGTGRDATAAVAAARKAFPSWRDTPWPQRLVVLRRTAELLTQRQVELAALLCMEVGKNRFEAIAEVSETADLITYYCRQMEEHGGYEIPMEGAGTEKTKSVLKSYGVWAVISPFNFPIALGGGMAAGALIGGNTVVLKPASDTPFIALRLYEAFRDAGLPDGVLNLVTGPGGVIGRELLSNPGVDALIFTGSRAVGMGLMRNFIAKYPRPCITEMGGKNPAIVMPSADLDAAAEGVYRSAFGMGGQKCSACSRLYVHRDVREAFMERLVARTKSCRIGDPLARETFLGPLINARAMATHERAMKLARREGRVLCGGRPLTEGAFEHGFFVEPAIVDRLPRGSAIFRDEYFAPLLAVAEVRTLSEAIERANESDYGLTAGIFTREETEKREFFKRVEAGVLYSNRRGGATTGAWPGVQSFGGWKGSGSSGKSALGPHYVAQFMREQSQTEIQS